VWCSASFAGNGHKGNEGSGGGNAMRSSPERVRVELSQLKEQTQKALTSASDLWTAPVQVQSLIPLLLRMHGSSSSGTYLPNSYEDEHGHDLLFINLPMREVIPGARFEVQEDPCMDSGKPSDASTLKAVGSPICFSVSRLTRISPSALKTQLIALFMHELAHQFGADEPTAQAFQKIILSRLKYANLYDRAKDCFMNASDLDYGDRELRLDSNSAAVRNSAIMYGLLLSEDSIRYAKLESSYVSKTEKIFPDLLKTIRKVDYDDLTKLTLDSILDDLPEIWFPSNPEKLMTRLDDRSAVYGGDDGLNYKQRQSLLMAHSEIVMNLIHAELSKVESTL